MTSHRLCALLACFLPPALVAVPASAQSSLRCAGLLLYDTDALAEPVVRAWASGVNTLTMRASGRMFISGANIFAINEISIQAGMQVLDVCFTGAGGAAVGTALVIGSSCRREGVRRVRSIEATVLSQCALGI